jgi:hypothetical protein
MAGRGRDEQVAQPVVERSWSDRRITTSKRRLPSTICEHRAPVRHRLQTLGHRRRGQAVEGRPLVIDVDAQLRDAHLLLDLEVDEALDARQALTQAFASVRSVSMSSP